MFILNDQPLSPDRAFTTEDGTQYPANWLRLSSPEEREAIGITEVPDPETYDQRFYWGPGLPKDHEQLVEQWVSQTKTTAGTLLAATDWMVTRSAEPNGKPVSQEVLDERAAIRAKSDEKEAAIFATADTDELTEYLTSAEYSQWAEVEPELPTDEDPTTPSLEEEQ